jgi:uncharacterized protein
MFTSQEKRSLKGLLSRIANPEEFTTLDGLHGYLFGLAIIPEAIMPSEWIATFFGENMPIIKNEQEANDIFGGLFSAYNRIAGLNQKGKLVFPFNLDTFKQNDIQRIREWAHGFYLATSLRFETWGMDEEEVLGDELDEEASFEGVVENQDEYFEEDDDEVTTCFAVVIGVAFPDRIPELYDKTGDNPEPSNIEARLFVMLPDAVASLQDYANSVRRVLDDRDGMAVETYPGEPQPIKVEKIGRNELCPCDSGLKYKKCCGK